ncbi:MAG: efflux RND transporter periplasmic adaptor subunit [Gemmatimonadaceae bacterium]|nr:efflux RND transporter periplasmic adaptor subunit [Gemmatimonadaceae bacterium]
MDILSRLRRIPRSAWIGLALVGVPSAWLLARGATPTDDVVSARVARGDFKITVTTAGELRAPKFVNISGPPNMQQAEVWNGVKILSIVPEGTVVQEGDVVAELDRAPVATKLADVNLALQKAEAQTEQASLDSVLNLSKAREDLHTAALTLEEKKLARDQSQFEAPSVRRQAEIEYEKALRTLKQDSMDLRTKTEQARAKMREVGSDLERQRNRLKIVQEVMGSFTIKAPGPGMVIYIKDWQGKKRAVGSQVSPWDPAVATLPDMSIMESQTYVNEIDVRKLAVGQPVTITLDADPGKRLTGKVTAVAGVGEQRPNSDAKVFEVKISVERPDTTLRPGMTTGNIIETKAIPNVLHIPLEAVMSENGVPYVFKKGRVRVTKQEVETGAMNDDEVIITRGLQEDDRVLLSPPADRDKIALDRLPGSKAGLAAPNGDTATGGKSVPVPSGARDGAAAKAAGPPRKG